MPAAAAPIIAAASAFASTAIGQAIVGTIISTVISTVAARLLSPSAEQKNAQAKSSTQINETGSLASIPLVYGKVRIAPNRVYVGTSNNDVSGAGTEEYLQVIYTVSNNVLLGAKDVYLNGEKVGEFKGPYQTSGYLDNYPYASDEPRNDVASLGTTVGGQINGFEINGAYRNRVSSNYSIDLDDDDIHFDLFTGENFQIADVDFIDSANDGIVNTDFRGAGWGGDAGNAVSYVYMRLKHYGELYSQGIPTLQIDVWGESHVDELLNPNDTTQTFKEKLIADVAVDPDLTLTDTGDFDRLGAVQIIDYLIHSYGRNLDPSDIDFDSFLEVAKIQLENSIFSDGVIDTNQTVLQNLNLLQANNLCSLIRSNGKYKLKYIVPEDDIYDANTFTFDENNILGDWKVSAGNAAADYDIAKVEFVNEDVDYLPDSITIYDSAIDLDTNYNPNNSKAVLDLTLPFTTNKDDARYLATVLMEQSKFDKVVSFKTTMEALQLEPYDPVYITHSLPGWTNEKYLVKEIAINADSTVDITLMEYADIYPLTLATERSEYLDVPAPTLAVTFMGTCTSGQAMNFELEADELLVASVVASEAGNIEDLVATSVTVGGNTLNVTATSQLNGESYSRSIGTAYATFGPGETMAQTNHTVTYTLPNTPDGSRACLWKIRNGTALHPANIEQSYTAREPLDTVSSMTNSISEVPAGAAMLYNCSTFDDNRSITTTTSGMSVSQVYEANFGNSRTEWGDNVPDSTARTDVDLVHSWSASTNWPKISTAVVIR